MVGCVRFVGMSGGPWSEPSGVDVRVTDVRSVWGPPLTFPLGEHVTVLVGPNRAGTSTVAWAVAAALDPTIRFRPTRDLPRRRVDPEPQVRFVGAEGASATVRFDPSDGRRHVDGDLPSGHVLLSRIHETPRDVLRRLPIDLAPEAARSELAARIHDVARSLLPEVDAVTIDERLAVEVIDDLGSALPVPETRAMTVLGVVHHLAAVGTAAVMAVLEGPEAFLHPAGQETLAATLPALAASTGTRLVITTSSPFVVPRSPDVQVVALTRETAGRTGLVASAPGDATQARLLGGLLRDAGLAAVLDRVAQIPAGTRAVLVVEGGTDEAYLSLAAARLDRAAVLDRVVVRPSGGAMGAALAALVLRAEVEVPVLVLLDHDDAGRRARDTLVSRFGFDRQREVVTYADVIEGSPPGVEAEMLFDPGLLRRFVAEHGPSATHGERTVGGQPHLDLTSSGKSAFVGYAADHVTPEQLSRWSDLLDLLAERLAAAT